MQCVVRAGPNRLTRKQLRCLAGIEAAFIDALPKMSLPVSRPILRTVAISRAPSRREINFGSKAGELCCQLAARGQYPNRLLTPLFARSPFAKQQYSWASAQKTPTQFRYSICIPIPRTPATSLSSHPQSKSVPLETRTKNIKRNRGPGSIRTPQACDFYTEYAKRTW